MELIGNETRAWAKERWDELLAKLPEMSTDRTDALLSALGGIATGMEAIAGFLPRRQPIDAEALVREMAMKNLTGDRLSERRLQSMLVLQKMCIEFMKESE